MDNDYLISRKLGLAFWPNPTLNESADRKAGNAAVDKMTIGELAQFFTETKAGPTWCLVTDRVQELLKQFPPYIEAKKERTVAALHAANLAFQALKTIAE